MEWVRPILVLWDEMIPVVCLFLWYGMIIVFCLVERIEV